MEAANDSRSFLGILQLLEGATAKNQLTWEDTADANEFRASVSYGYVWFARYPEVPPGTFSMDALPGDFTITFKDNVGKIIEQTFALGPEEVKRALLFLGTVRRSIRNEGHIYDSMLDDLRRRAGV